jgi:hypothetical protein
LKAIQDTGATAPGLQRRIRMNAVGILESILVRRAPSSRDVRAIRSSLRRSCAPRARSDRNWRETTCRSVSPNYLHEMRISDSQLRVGADAICEKAASSSTPWNLDGLAKRSRGRPVRRVFTVVPACEQHPRFSVALIGVGSRRQHPLGCMTYTLTYITGRGRWFYFFFFFLLYIRLVEGALRGAVRLGGVTNIGTHIFDLFAVALRRPPSRTARS